MIKLFRDRKDGGHLLARELRHYHGKDLVLLAIPKGGVPVACEAARRLQAPLDLIIPRKLPIPWNPEAGFGAVTSEGSIVLNQRMIEPLGLEEDQIKEIAEKVRLEIKRREEEFRKGRPPIDLKDKTVVIIDDGIASGYTMLAAIRSVRRHSPKLVIAATPVASASSAALIRPQVDKFIALIESHHLPFAVADYYLNWYDVSDDEVKECLHSV